MRDTGVPRKLPPTLARGSQRSQLAVFRWYGEQSRPKLKKRYVGKKLRLDSSRKVRKRDVKYG